MSSAALHNAFLDHPPWFVMVQSFRRAWARRWGLKTAPDLSRALSHYVHDHRRWALITREGVTTAFFDEVSGSIRWED